MKKLAAIICLALLFTIVGAGLAQDATAEPAGVPPQPFILQPDIVPELERLVERAEAASEQANERVDRAFNLLGLFESIGLILTLFTIAGPLVGAYFTRTAQRASDEVQRANDEVKQARDELEKTRREVEIQLQATKDLQDTSRELESALIAASDEFRKSSERLEKEVREALRLLEEQMANNRAELGEVRADIESSGAEQRERTRKALMGQSLQSLGERQYRATDFQGAIDTLNRALELDEYNPITHYQLGYVHINSENLEQAEHHLKRALEIDPELAQALATLGYVYRRSAERMSMSRERMERMNAAGTKLLEALKISPRLIDDDGESWWGSLGGLYRRQGQLDEAIHAYKEAAEITPQSSYPFSNLALLYLERGEIESMIETYTTVEQLAQTETQAEPKNYWAFSDLLTSRLAQGKLEQAEEALASLFYTVPKDANYPLEVLVNTLKRLAGAMTDEIRVGQIKQFINRIQLFIEGRKVT